MRFISSSVDATDDLPHGLWTGFIQHAVQLDEPSLRKTLTGWCNNLHVQDAGEAQPQFQQWMNSAQTAPPKTRAMIEGFMRIAAESAPTLGLGPPAGAVDAAIAEHLAIALSHMDGPSMQAAIRHISNVHMNEPLRGRRWNPDDLVLRPTNSRRCSATHSSGAHAEERIS
jgi:hypothetical protein